MHGAGGCLIRTTYYQERLRRRLAERLSQREYVFTLQTQSLFDGSLPGVPHFVYTDHAELQCLDLPGFSPKQLFPARWLARETSIYENAAVVFTMSDATRRCLVEQYGCPEDRVAWVRAGTNAPQADGEVSAPHRYENQRILFVGARWEPKGGPELAAAFERVLALHPRAELTIVGCSPELDLRNCEVVGPIPCRTGRGLLRPRNGLLLPTRREAYGIAFLEALAHGLPVVATRVGALRARLRGPDRLPGRRRRRGRARFTADGTAGRSGDMPPLGSRRAPGRRDVHVGENGRSILRRIEEVVGPL